MPTCPEAEDLHIVTVADLRFIIFRTKVFHYLPNFTSTNYRLELLRQEEHAWHEELKQSAQVTPQLDALLMFYMEEVK